jgi:hypothetical protein
MRIIRLAVLAAALVCAPAAFAQETGAQQANAPVIHPGAQRYAHIVLVDTGLLDQAIEAVSKKLGPELSKSVLQQPWAANLDQQKREKLVAYAAGFPERVFPFLKEQLPQIETAVAIAYSKEFTAEEADAVANYFGSPDGLAVFKAITGATITTYAECGQRPTAANVLSQLSKDQIASLNAFALTPGGRAFSRVGGKSRNIMSDAISGGATAAAAAKLRVQVREEVCAIVGEPCPLPPAG